MEEKDRTSPIIINGWGKRYGGRRVLDGFSYIFRPGRIYCLEGESGAGKTTLLRLLAGLEQPDGGTAQGLEGLRITMAFQEDRLCDWEDAVTNAAIAVSSKEGGSRSQIRGQARDHLLRLLPEECLAQPVDTFSGGMKRRVALVRAVYPDSDLVLLDEPFNGLDEENRLAALEYVREEQRGRIVIFTSHRPEEAGRLGAETIKLQPRRGEGCACGWGGCESERRR